MTTTTKLPTWYWIVGVFLVLWNGMGVSAYLYDVTLTEADFASMEEGMRGLYENTPIWAKVGYALAVWFGLAGAIFLLLRKSWAVPAFLVSLLGILVQQTHIYFLSDNIEVMGAWGLLLPIAVLLIGAWSVYYSRNCRSKGWIS